jgi:hypothetical protein
MKFCFPSARRKAHETLGFDRFRGWSRHGVGASDAGRAAARRDRFRHASRLALRSRLARQRLGPMRAKQALLWRVGLRGSAAVSPSLASPSLAPWSLASLVRRLEESPHLAGFFFAVKRACRFRDAAIGRCIRRVKVRVVEEKVWRPGLDLHQDKKLCTAPASTFRHRADRNIPRQLSTGQS